MNKKTIHISYRPFYNQGVVLFISLIILMVLTIVGLSAMNNSNVELQTASNNQEKNIANQAAQAGLNAVMCLGDEDLTGSSDDNPFNKTYAKINTNADVHGKKYNWDWDRTTYDSENVYPFAGVTSSTAKEKCSILSNGKRTARTSNIGKNCI